MRDYTEELPMKSELGMRKTNEAAVLHRTQRKQQQLHVDWIPNISTPLDLDLPTVKKGKTGAC